jgi:hypothetical protein
MLDGKLVDASEHRQAGPQIIGINAHTGIVTGPPRRVPRHRRL